ncbi:RluA family pseudouridine synthase [Roseicyclus persicicus]|uniref:Pseudouridine synthase n=1 Tax=Roseicyclus persicicus TaxID=2650661 RepID=A0A7X6JY78_9RHOB|nr:RluA family pseudouridine synthase [Roseibacterium persicicum]NKX45525.1 RluA family pseudouridine synthase [Roseibacterium persicicum]
MTDPNPAFAYAPPDAPLDVIHADDHLLVLNKPAGLLSVPGRGEHLADCLMERARAAFPTALLVHRLDMDTSGVMVFALTPHAQRHLGQQFEHRQTKKVYVARVWGAVAEAEGEIDLPLCVDWPNRPRQHVNWEKGKPAKTAWRRIRVEDGTTRMRLYPRTGRSHQLRVHMKEIGHPILGDPFYAEGAARAFPRLMLHAESLKLKHPEGGQGMLFRAPVPF